LEIREREREVDQDAWFNQEWPMTVSRKTWKEKCIEKEEKGSDLSSDSEAAAEMESKSVDTNMVFHLPDEFALPELEVVQLVLGTERAVFVKHEKLGHHMKLLYVKGHLDGTPINQMLVDESACVNIMPSTMFEKLGHKESELKKTNMTLNGFAREVNEANDIISKELTVGSKTIRTTFFVVDVKGKYNILLGWDWIHTNGCVPSSLH
jgi:hypothetical protein